MCRPDPVPLCSTEANMKTVFILLIIFSFPAYVFSAQKHQCDYCHTPHGMAEGTPLKAPLSELCLGCHPDRKNPKEHKVDIVPSMQVKGLPLDKDGKMTCITCHDPHGKSGFPTLLRIDPAELCFKCHFSDGK
jgi:predicted CXXCH cytochrome family protein